MADDDLILEDAEEAMRKSVDALERDLGKIRTGRANPALLESLSVDYYNTATPLKGLATITAPEARLLLVQPFDPSSMTMIEKAILTSDLGLSPANDGRVMRVPIPELNEERRRGLVKLVKKHGEDHKLGIRGARRDAITMLKDLEKRGDLSKDDSRKAQKKVQDMTEGHTARIDHAVNAKEREVLTI